MVIDGPEKWRLEQVQEAVKTSAEGKSRIKVVIHQNSHNLGRFKARLIGAQLAKCSQLLFVDDRVEIEANYIEVVSKLNEKIALPSVIERDTANPIGRVNNLFRKKIFGKHIETSYPILPENFDQLPKGTSGLWLPRDWFISSCHHLKSQTNIDATMSDDTKLLKDLVQKHGRIYRANEAVIFYNPREGIIESIVHLFHRGPKFVDYYFKPGRRFFVWLLIFYTMVFPAIILLILKPFLALWLLILLLLISIWLDQNFVTFPYTALGVIFAGLSFGLGLIAGLFKKY